MVAKKKHAGMNYFLAAEKGGVSEELMWQAHTLTGLSGKPLHAQINKAKKWAKKEHPDLGPDAWIEFFFGGG